MIGQRIASYEITARLGEGGMGEVYRARDTRLGRDVAVKVLLPAFLTDGERRARFEREARVLAALNHPNIATIHGIEDDAGTRAIVMELVEGETLAERLARGPVPVAEVLPLAGQIAEALEAAHEKGIAHRDLKPANIKVTPAGTVKVLDFGLAKLATGGAGTDLSHAPTVTAGGTREGVLLGTAAYMSPEQARGQAVDKQTDVWAFGCVLYELLTGRRPFPGQTMSDTIAAVLEREPDWTQLPPSTPAAVRRLLRRCLEKDPKERLRDIGDARIWLDEALAPDHGEATVVERTAPSRHRLWLTVAGGALAGALGMSLALAMLDTRTSDTLPAVTRTTVMLPADQELDTASQRSAPLAISPDGRRLAYVARTEGRAQLYVRDLDAFEGRPLMGTDGARYPFFSPDGQSIAFFADDRLKRVALQGGSPVTICEAAAIRQGGTWGSDGTIVFSSATSGLMAVPAAGGTPEPIASDDPEMDARELAWPQFLPDGRTLLVTVNPGAIGPSLAALSLAVGTWQPLVRGSQATYVPSGHLIFHAPDVREGEMQAVAFDIGRLSVQGEPISVFDGVFRSENAGGAYFAVAGNGTVVLAPGGHARTLVRVDRNGRRTPLLSERRGFRLPSISPDGRKVAVTVDPRPSQVWVYDLERKSGVRLSTDGHNYGPTWAPDGLRVAYNSGNTISWRVADGGEAEEPVLLDPPGTVRGSSWSHDGRFFLFQRVYPTHQDIWVRSDTDDPRPLFETPAQDGWPSLSRNDRWLAYMSTESGRREVYVRPFPDVGAGKWLVSIGGGSFPAWSPTSDELFFVNGTAMMAVRYETEGGTFRASTPELLFTGPFETGSPQFDVAPDGSYFVMVEADPDARPTHLNVVTNWTEELKRLVPR